MMFMAQPLEFHPAQVIASPSYLLEMMAGTIWGTGGFRETQASSFWEFGDVDLKCTCKNISVLLLEGCNSPLTASPFPHRCPVHRPTCLHVRSECCSVGCKGCWEELSPLSLGLFQGSWCVPGAQRWSVSLFHIETVQLVFHNAVSMCIN